jgi:hypothetical protein
VQSTGPRRGRCRSLPAPRCSEKVLSPGDILSLGD